MLEIEGQPLSFRAESVFWDREGLFRQLQALGCSLDLQRCGPPLHELTYLQISFRQVHIIQAIKESNNKLFLDDTRAYSLPFIYLLATITSQ